MFCRLFVKHLLFCVMVLSVGIHAINSVAESVDRLPKTTSILSICAKAVIVSLAFAQVQVLASSFSQKKLHSLNKRQEQQDSNVCVANSDDIFYVGQNNFTRCLEQNPRGTFIFVERVNFTQFSEKEKNRYPLYNNSLPFSGSLTMFPYSFDHFNISRNGSAAMFRRLENATIRANLTYPDVTGGITEGISVAASVAHSLIGHNTLEVELDSASIKSRRGSFACGIIGNVATNSINDISVRVKNYLDVSTSITGGGVICSVSSHSSLNLSAIIDTLTLECITHGSYGGIIGRIETGTRIKIKLKGSLISIIDRTTGGGNRFLSACYSKITGLTQIKTDIQIDNVIIESSMDKESVGSVIYTVLSSQLVNHKTILIRKMHVKIEAGEANAIGVRQVAHRTQKMPPFYILSINGTLGSSNHIFGPEHLSCTGSMIDWSGVHLNTNNLGCNGTLELKTLRPEHWREAHRLVAVELCQDQNNCFYVHEDLLALVKERDNSFFLVTRQRYPYNNANDGQGIVRVIQYILDKSQYDPIINASFAINGTRLFTNATETLLSVERPLSTSLTDDHQLLMLYGETGNLKIASMPLIGMNDATYEIHTVQSSAAPVQIDKNILWLNQNGNLLAYNASSASTEIFSRNTTLSSWPGSVNLIGAQRYQDYVYTAQLENGTHLFMARFFNDGRQDANWTSSLPFAYDHTYHQLQISGENNEPIISFPHVTELYQHNLLNRSYTTIKLPSRGGVGEWHYSNESFTKTLLFIITPQIINNTDVNLSENGKNSNVVGTVAAGILVPVCVIGGSLLKKRLMPFLKKCYTWHKKTKPLDQ